MKIERTGPQSLKIFAPAKLNLFLEVLGKRTDGYHQLDTVMHSVDLYDILEIGTGEGDPQIETSGRGMGDPEENLALKAARLFKRSTGSRKGARIRLCKQIPVGAGLGGGSSDCAAVLLACNELAGRPLPQDRLRDMGAELGSDVPFFLHCGTAVCSGRGESVTTISGVPRLHFLIIYPGFSLSTGRVYRNLNLDLTEHKKKNTFMNVLLKNKQPEKINACLFNRLERPALETEPELGCAMKKAREMGFAALKVSGSGSSFYQCIEEQEVREVENKLFHIDSHWEGFLVASSLPLCR